MLARCSGDVAGIGMRGTPVLQPCSASEVLMLAGRLSALIAFQKRSSAWWISSAFLWSPACTAFHSDTHTPGTAAGLAAMVPCAPSAKPQYSSASTAQYTFLP